MLHTMVVDYVQSFDQNKPIINYSYCPWLFDSYLDYVIFVSLEKQDRLLNCSSLLELTMMMM